MSANEQRPVFKIDFTQVRQRVPLRAFVESLGSKLQQEGETYRCACPLHDERHGQSFIIYSGETWFCHGKCAATYSKGGDVVDLAGALWSLTSPAEIVERLLGEAPKLQNVTPRRRSCQPSAQQKWPPRNLEKLDAIVRTGFGLYDLSEASPIRFDPCVNEAEKIIDVLFPGGPLLCVGQTEWRFATDWRENWRGWLHEYPLIVANPMLKKIGLTRYGKPSEHTLEATARRVYLPIECDFEQHDKKGKPTVFLPLIEGWQRDGITTADACCAILWHLKERLPLVLGVHTGGKGVHGWFAAFDRDEDELWAFMRCAFSLGADHVTWCRSQFVRLPDGTRANGARQVPYFLDPGKAVTL